MRFCLRGMSEDAHGVSAVWGSGGWGGQCADGCDAVDPSWWCVDVLCVSGAAVRCVWGVGVGGKFTDDPEMTVDVEIALTR